MKKRLIAIATAFSLVAGSVIGGGQITKVKAAGVEIKAENFGGDTNIAATAKGADANKDGILSDQEAAKITSLYFLITTSDISPIIKYFPNVTSVDINVGNSASLKIGSSKVKALNVDAQKVINITDGGSITEVTYYVINTKGKVDFSKAKGYEKVKKFSLSGPNLTGAVAPNQSKLTELRISSTKISKIDVSKYKNVKTLNLSANQLKSINVKKNKSLVSLACYNNKLKSLNIASNKNLKDIGVGSNKLTKLDTSKNSKLTRINSYSNNIKKYSPASNKKLTSLTMSDNKLTKLDVSKNKKLEILDVSVNKIKKLDVSKNKSLKYLSVGENKLTKFNVTKNTKLATLKINNNKIKNITLSKNKKLTALCVGFTSLKKLSLAKSAKIGHISVGKQYNLLKNVKLQSNTYVGVCMKLSANKVYELTKIMPQLKGYQFVTYSDLFTVDENGKLKMPSVKKNQYLSVYASKGKSTVSIELNSLY